MINSHPGKAMPFSFNNESPFCLQMRIQLERQQAWAALKEKKLHSAAMILELQAESAARRDGNVSTQLRFYVGNYGRTFELIVPDPNLNINNEETFA